MVQKWDQDPGTRDRPQNLKVGPGTPLKFKSGTPGPSSKFKSGTPFIFVSFLNKVYTKKKKINCELQKSIVNTKGK